jgi:protoheme IX farnesyltransferase
VTLSALAAWVVASGKATEALVLPVTAIFLLACGASVLNQIQEKKQDALMDRTKNRSLPSGKITSPQAAFFATFLLFAGFGILAYQHYWICIFLGVLNILWYNGFYTWLKKKTAFAVVPGALSGVIPVFMGWSSAGGSLGDRHVILLAFFLFIWQIPHFWLLMLKYGDEYRRAGFPVMTDIFTQNQFRNIIFSWMTGATGMSLLLILSGFWMVTVLKVMIMILNLLILAIFFFQLYVAKYPRYKLMFITMNTFLIVVLSSMILEKLFP